MSVSYAAYAGTVPSAIARCKRILKAAGFPWWEVKGRYTPFDNQQIHTPGIRVRRVGYSTNVAVQVNVERGDHGLVEALAVSTLRDAGLPFDDRGWLACSE